MLQLFRGYINPMLMVLAIFRVLVLLLMPILVVFHGFVLQGDVIFGVFQGFVLRDTAGGSNTWRILLVYCSISGFNPTRTLLSTCSISDIRTAGTAYTQPVSCFLLLVPQYSQNFLYCISTTVSVLRLHPALAILRPSVLAILGVPAVPDT